jgi:hypothetical protein
MFRFMGAAGYHGTDVDLRAIGSAEPWSVGDCRWASSADEAFVVRWQWPRRGMPILHRTARRARLTPTRLSVLRCVWFYSYSCRMPVERCDSASLGIVNAQTPASVCVGCERTGAPACVACGRASHRPHTRGGGGGERDVHRLSFQDLREMAVQRLQWSLGSPLPHLRQDLGSLCRICAGTWAQPCHICTGTWAPLPLGLGLTCHISAGTGPTPATSAPRLAAPATSAPGLGLPCPHLRWDRSMRSSMRLQPYHRRLRMTSPTGTRSSHHTSQRRQPRRRAAARRATQTRSSG